MVGCKAIWNPCHEVVGNEAVECDDGGIREGAADLCLRGLDAAAGEREEAGEEGVDDLLGSAASAHVGRGAGRRGGQRRGVGYPSGRSRGGGGEVVGGARGSHRGGRWWMRTPGEVELVRSGVRLVVLIPVRMSLSLSYH